MRLARSGFSRRSTAEQVTEGIDLSGKTVFITGVNSGLGFESMRVLSERGAHIIGAARTLDKAREACGKIAGQTTPVACELSDLDSVRACADQITSRAEPLDVVLCNAGIMALPRLEKKMDLELQFLTNHLGHFVLVNRLIERVKAATAGRVVIVSSLAHRQAPPGGIQFDNLGGQRWYNGWAFYGQSKLANILFSNELSRRLAGTRATSNALHPGIIHTGLSRYSEGPAALLTRRLARLVHRSVPQGAATSCYVASHPRLEGITGRYFSDSNVSRPSSRARNRSLARKLWERSEELAADYL